MKNLLNTKHVPAGVITALFAGSLWVLALRNVGNMSLHDIQTWILPLILIWGMIGSLVGLIGRRNGNTLLKVGFSTLFGTGLSPIAILPIMVMVVLPVGKFADAIGLINRTTISSDVATTLVITAMMTIWLVLGIALGILLLYLTIKKPEQNVSQMPAPEHPL